jgi:hypothetical protein
MSQVIDAFKTARTLLDDDLALNWNDPVLMPKLVQAHGEMIAKLILNGQAPVRENTALINLTIGALSLGISQPMDLIKPIKMDEGIIGDDISNQIPMEKVDFFPNLDQEDTLRYWAFNKNLITFMGSTAARQVRLYYIGEPVAPSYVTDTLYIPMSEIFLGPRIAALCVIKKDPALYQACDQIAQDGLSKIVRTYVKGDQNLPVRRRPFSFSVKSRRRYTV